MKTTLASKHNRLLTIACLTSVLVTAACQPEGSAEKTGKKIDQATEKAGIELEKAKESVIEKTESAGEYIDDSVITAKIKEAMGNDDFLKASQIEVTTNNGVVRLSGAVDSEQIIGRAIGLANSQKYVKSVQNDLVVNAGSVGK